MSRRVVGVLGGMGPAATWDFCARLPAAFAAARDQDHPRVLVDCDPSVPDRNAAVAGTGPSPGPRLAAMARDLEAAGAELLCMPCNAAHAYAGEVRDAVAATFVDMIEATVVAVRTRVPQASTVAVLATRGTLRAGLYERAFAPHGVRVAPVAEERRSELMSIVYAVKAGDRSSRLRERAERLARAFALEGAGAVIAACTEVPLVLDAAEVPVPLVASSDALADAVAALATRSEVT